MDILKPDLHTLISLGSLVVHYEEWTSPHGHPNDKVAIDTLRNQLGVKEWFEQMDKLALLPVKRNLD